MGWGSFVRAVYGIWRMMARRSLANWRLALTLALGVLVAATLLASAPIYARAMADLGLTFTIRDRLLVAPSTQVLSRDVPVAAEDGRGLQQAVGGRADERTGWFTAARERVLIGPRFFIATEGQPPAPRAPIAATEYISSVEGHIRIVDGRLPQPRTEADGRRVIELAVSQRSLQQGGLRVGERVSLAEWFDDCAREIPREDRPPPPPCTPKTTIRFTFPAEIVGVVEPLDPEDLFWVTGAKGLFEPYTLLQELGPVLPALTDEDTFFNGIGGVLPEYRATMQWNYFADPEKLTRANYQRARDEILALREDVRPLDTFAYSPLEGVLSGFQRELSFQQAPLLILLLQIAGIALFYVGVIAAMVVERQADEIALLRSRGAGRWQVAGVYLLEGLTLGIPVTLIAPLLAVLGTAALGLTPTFRRVTDGDLLPVRLSPEAFGLAAAGAGLSLVMLIGPAFIAAGLTGVTARRRRPDAPPLLHRYYLDMAVVALTAVLLWELNERGSVFTPSSTGGVSSDPLLLISPALITLAASALVLRFAPMVLRLALFLVGGVAGTPVVMGLWQMVRNPGQYTRLTLLLMMAVAVGTFAASYASTSERSFRDRASYESGVDVRAGLVDILGGTRETAESFASIPGVQRAALAIRGRVTPATPGSGRQEISVLAVDPDAAAEMLWFRDDLAPESLKDLMAHVRGPAPRGKPLPDGATAISLWANPTEPRESTTMWVRVRDSQGVTRMFELGKLEFSGWRQLRAELFGGLGAQLTPPLTLVSVVLSEPSNVNAIRPSPLYLDDITAEGAAGGAVVLDDFEGSLAWDAALSRTQSRGAQIQDELRAVNEQAHGGSFSARFTFRPGITTGLRGIYVRDPNIPLPVVVNPEFLSVAGGAIGQTVMLEAGEAQIPVVIRGVTRLFPTVGGGVPLMIANRDQYSAWISVFHDLAAGRPNEVWLQLQPEADRAATLKAVLASPARPQGIVDREAVLRSVNANPLIAAGGSGILLAAFVAVFVLVAVALLVTLIASVQRRRTEFAVLRAMGVSRGQVFRLLAFEYALVAVLGLGAGVYVGLIVGRRMLSFLDVTESGDPVVPPFILQTNWLMVGLAILAVCLTFLTGMALSAGAVRRQAPGQALRQTE